MSELTRKKNEASEIMFAMVDSTTPANLKSGLTVTDDPYYKDGAGAWTALTIADAATEIGTTGMYTIEMTAAELNHDLILIKLTATGAADTIVVIRTTAQDIDDVNTTTPPTVTQIRTEMEGAGHFMDTITGSDGVVLATQQLNYAPNTVIPDAMGTAAGLHATTDGKIDAVQTDTTAIKAKTDNLPSGMAKNVAIPKFDVFMVLASDHVTGATGKTVTGTISKDGGAFTALTNPITEVDAGMYTIASGLTQDERNADVSTLKFSADGCDDRIITIISS